MTSQTGQRLDDIVVVEMAGSLAGAHATKLLGDLGAISDRPPA